MKRLLMFKTMMCCEESVKNGLIKLGYDVDVISGNILDYDNDVEIKKAFLSYFEKCISYGIICDAIISIDYYPVISTICSTMKIPYISWIVDCPMNTLYSKTIQNEINWIFAFDRKQYEELNENGAKHCFHMPLATDIQQWDKVSINQSDYEKYQSDVSFLGNLYNDKKSNSFLGINYLPQYLKGFYDGLIKTQLEIYGMAVIEQALTKEILDESKKYIDFNLKDTYFYKYTKLLSDMLYTEVSHLERINIISMLVSNFDMSLYTSSDLSEFKDIKIANKGYVDYLGEMPKVFKLSKININITSKSIQSGIPLRVLDVLGAGGFLITNYQPEIAEMFENGKELVMYESVDDLKRKVTYYLEHEDERKEIARAGYEHVKREFSYEKQLLRIMECVDGK